MTQRQILEQYLGLLREVHSLTLTENSRLRAGHLPERKLQAEKSDLSRRLDVIIHEVAGTTPSPEPERAHTRTLQNRLQEQMLQTILLDRENESLLLKLSFERCTVPLQSAPAAVVRRAYFS
jgi:hypothetical protein